MTAIQISQKCEGIYAMASSSPMLMRQFPLRFSLSYFPSSVLNPHIREPSLFISSPLHITALVITPLCQAVLFLLLSSTITFIKKTSTMGTPTNVESNVLTATDQSWVVCASPYLPSSAKDTILTCPTLDEQCAHPDTSWSWRPIAESGHRRIALGVVHETQRDRQRAGRQNWWTRTGHRLWHMLPCEVQEYVLSKLTLHDVDNAHEAGLGKLPDIYGTRCGATKGEEQDTTVEKKKKMNIRMRNVKEFDGLKMEMRRRINALRPVYEEWHRSGGDMVLTPLQFAGRMTLVLRNCDMRMLRTVGQELVRMWTLRLDRWIGDEGCEGLKSLPEELGRCTWLHELSLCGHKLKMFPMVVMGLYRLRILDLSENEEIDELPEDLGVKLQSLQCVDLMGTRVSKLPRSMLWTLDRNNAEYHFACGGRARRCALRVNKAMFKPGYLAIAISQVRYPMLALDVMMEMEGGFP